MHESSVIASPYLEKVNGQNWRASISSVAPLWLYKWTHVGRTRTITLQPASIKPASTRASSNPNPVWKKKKEKPFSNFFRLNGAKQLPPSKPATFFNSHFETTHRREEWRVREREREERRGRNMTGVQDEKCFWRFIEWMVEKQLG